MMSTTKDEALKLALEALEESNTDNDTMEFHDRKNKAITAIKQALLTATPLAAPYVAPQLVQEPDELKHIDEQDCLLDVDEKAWRSLVENRGGCRCHISPPCGACSNPISEEELNEAGYTYTTPPNVATPPAQEFVCSTGLCHFTLTQTNVGIGKRAAEAYEAAKKRGWVGISDERMMEMPKQEPIAYLHQCGKKPELKELSFKKNEPLLAAKGYKAIPLTSPPIEAPPLAQRKPLTDEEIDAIADEYLVDYRIPAGCALNFARDIEAAHGIKGDA
jgi:hypothetical protein